MTLSKKTKIQLISEVKKLQRKIELLNKPSSQKKTKKWAPILEHSANVVVVIDKQLTILDINRGSRKNVIGRKAFDFNPKNARTIKKAIETVFKTAKPQEYIVEGVSLAGKMTYHSCKASPLIEQKKVSFVIVEATDITNEIVAQNTLKQNASKFKMLADNAIDVVYRFEILPKPHYEYVSPSATAITGYSPEEFYADSYLGFKMVHPEDSHLLDNSEKTLKKKSKLKSIKEPQLIVRWIKKDGTTIWSETRNTPIFNANGKLIAIEGISRDITQQKQNEEKLKESEARFKILSNATFEGIVFSENGKVIDANDQFLKMYGYKLQELIGKHVINDFIVPGQRNEAKQLIRLPSSELFEVQTYRKDKSIISVMSKGQNIPYFGRTIRATVVYNISERKRYEQQLRESERTLSTLMNNLRGMAYRCDFDDKWTMRFISKGFRELTGYSPKNFIDNKKMAFSDIIHPEDRHVGSDQIKYAIKTRTPFEIEYRIITKKGEIKWVWEKGEGIFSEEDGKLLFLEGFISDVNDKKQYELEITKSRENYKSLVDYSPDGVIIHVNGEIKFANPSALKIIGVDSFEELENISGFEFILPEYHQQLNDRIILSMDEKKLDFVEIKIKNKKGEIKELETKPIPIKYNGMDATQVVFHDLSSQKQLLKEQLRTQIAEETNQKLQQEINERKNAERILRSSQQYTRLLIDSSLDVICASDKDGFITEFNAAGQKVFGYELHEVIGKHAKTLYANPEERASVVEKALYETGEFTGEVKNIKKNGEVFSVYLSASLLRNDEGEMMGVMGISHDISERIKIEEQMHAQTAKLNSIIENSSHIIWTVDKNKCLTLFNKNFADYTKYQYDVDAKMGLSMVSGKVFSTTEHNNLWIEKYDAALKGESQYFETKLNDRHGNLIWREIFLNPIYDENKNIVEVSGMGLDITENKLSEDKITQSLREKDVLLKEVHHRVKNNLQVISSILNLQSSYVKDERILNILKESQNRIKSMAFIHESLYQTKDFSNINFSEYITSLSHNLIHSYSNLDHEIKLTLDIELIFLNLDLAIPCGLIINEIITNALKYAFNVDSRDAEITIKIQSEGENLKIIIGDNGIGLPQQINYRNTESLGLQLVVTLTDQLNGKIDLDTKKGTFYTIVFKQNQIKNRI